MNEPIEKIVIDVVIPAYNAERFIIETITSIVKQTLSPQQIIVVDDGSTDRTYELVSVYEKTSPVPIVIVQKKNNGLSSARNAGIARSTAPLIAFVDADDLWEPTKLQKQLAIFTGTTFINLGLVYCDYKIIDKKGSNAPYHRKAMLDYSVRGHAFKKLLPANKILSSGSGVLIKKIVFDDVGIFDETLQFGEDWDMWLRIAQKYEIDFVAETLVSIRRHEENMTHSLIKVFIGELNFYKKWLPRLKKDTYSIPIRWRAKIVFRIVTLWPKKAIIKQALPILFVPFR